MSVSEESQATWKWCRSSTMNQKDGSETPHSRLSQGSGCGEPGGGSPNTEAQLLIQVPVAGALGLPHFGPYQSKGRLLSQRECNNHFKSLGSETKRSSPRITASDVQMAPTFPQSTWELRKKILSHFNSKRNCPTSTNTGQLRKKK